MYVPIHIYVYTYCMYVVVFNIVKRKVANSVTISHAHMHKLSLHTHIHHTEEKTTPKRASTFSFNVRKWLRTR